MTGRSPRDAVEWHRRVAIEEAEPLASGDSSLPGRPCTRRLRTHRLRTHRFPGRRQAMQCREADDA